MTWPQYSCARPNQGSSSLAFVLFQFSVPSVKEFGRPLISHWKSYSPTSPKSLSGVCYNRIVSSCESPYLGEVGFNCRVTRSKIDPTQGWTVNEKVNGNLRVRKSKIIGKHRTTCQRVWSNCKGRKGTQAKMKDFHINGQTFMRPITRLVVFIFLTKINDKRR